MNKFKNLFKKLYLKFSDLISEVEEDPSKINGNDPNYNQEYPTKGKGKDSFIKIIKLHKVVVNCSK